MVEKGLSSGEIALLNMYSRFLSLVSESTYKYQNNKLPKETKEMTIIIDECDVYLHPTWQRTYIYDLFKMCSNLFNDKKINFILTTHSPLILSDIPKNNIILLEKENDSIKSKRCELNTFGQNLHAILKNEFFLDSTIGEFAKQNIIEITNKIDNLANCNNLHIKNIIAIENKINIIGEPIIRKCLQDKLNESAKFLSKAEEIKYYEDKIEKLKNEEC